MKKLTNVLIWASSLLPVISFASTGDTTFTDIYTQISGYLTGSLGLVFVILGFLGAGAAVAGFASMKVMFPVFGLALALHYGPKILESVFGATGDFSNNFMHHVDNFSIANLIVMMLATSIFIFGYMKYKNKQSLTK